MIKTSSEYNTALDKLAELQLDNPNSCTGEMAQIKADILEYQKFTMNNPNKHIHHDKIVEWAADTSRAIQCRRPPGGKWLDIESAPSWLHDLEYRFADTVKKEVISSLTDKELSIHREDWFTYLEIVRYAANAAATREREDIISWLYEFGPNQLLSRAVELLKVKP